MSEEPVSVEMSAAAKAIQTRIATAISEEGSLMTYGSKVASIESYGPLNGNVIPVEGTCVVEDGRIYFEAEVTVRLLHASYLFDDAEDDEGEDDDE